MQPLFLFWLLHPLMITAHGFVRAHKLAKTSRLLEPSQPLGVMAAAADEFIKTFGAINVCIYLPEAGR